MTRPAARPGERHPREPTSAAFTTKAAAYFHATRPAFLSVTLVGVLLGIASAYYDAVSIDAASAIPTLLFALVAHAGVNVLNDYYDHLNGTDAANVERIFPFTGGSRFIQNSVISARETARLGYALLAAVVAAGLLLTVWAGPGLLAIGLAGLLIGWAYSAPPLELNSRGLGEACVGAGFLLVVVGADYVQRHGFDSTPFAAGLPYALFVTNLLYINQFPDRTADLHAGKLHWVARLEPRTARWSYLLIAFAAGPLTLSGVARNCLPATALISLLAWIPAAFAARELFGHADESGKLGSAIKATITAALMHGVLLACALVLSR
jgi:1,4-dihydroxy-2-naphthoate octaprenyltransferase